jgi:biopolymer transport protein TolR
MAGPVYGGNGRGATRRYRPMAEINVTPLVDVMLVLLIVFMVTAPLLAVGVPVDLPQTAAPPIAEPKEPLTITVNRDGEIFVQETSVPIDSLVEKLQEITGSDPDSVLYVRGDKDINYGRVLEVMSLVTAGGFHKVSLVAEAPKQQIRAAATRPEAAHRSDPIQH